MAQYRKKPVVIEAGRYDGSGVPPIVTDGQEPWEVAEGSDGLRLLIPTLEGVMTANPGDWIIKGVNGEFYPCKDEIFHKTYEAVKGA